MNSSLDETCEAGSHGMLLGLPGIPHKDLYSDTEMMFLNEAVAQAGAGLFIKGGNPLYYTAKGTQEELARQIHAVLKSNLDDLGGHHVVLRVEEDAQDVDGKPLMSVHKLPLLSNPQALADASDRESEDPVEIMYAASADSALTSGGNDGWLTNLAGTMRSEQASVDQLYPPNVEQQQAASAGVDAWSCPLLRIAFWSQVTQDFSPLTPSPIRAARLFSGLEMTHGTRSHPTQMFSSLYSRLGNIHTSNGFCYCLNKEQCQVKHSALDSSCTLLETIRSLYDQKFRTAQVLTTASNVCKDQLDWPFEQGVMRDRSIYGGRNSASEQCNTLDRLPLFQYRYVPAGTVKKPADAKTSLDQGGVCHMGRAVNVDSKMVASTQVCRKIYSNYTHIVARCSGNQNTFTDYELKKERSAAPDWMVDQLRSQKRQKCDVCSPPPVWKTESGMFDLPHGPEVSYGIPFRWSASRLLAADVRTMVCGSRHNDSQACSLLLKEQGFATKEAFSQAFFGSNMESQLFSDRLSGSNKLSIKEAILNFSNTLKAGLDEDMFLWGGSEAPGWVACTQTNSTCHGKISKADWYNRTNRYQVCNNVFAEQVKLGKVNSTAQGLDICSLSTKTNTLCQVLPCYLANHLKQKLTTI